MLPVRRSSRWSSTHRQPAPPSTPASRTVAARAAVSRRARRSADALASASCAGALGGPRQLGLAQPLLHAGQVGGHPPGDHSRIGRPVLRLGGQTVAGQGQELKVGTAMLQPGQRRGRVRPPRRSKDLARPAARERRRAGQDLAEDRAQREDVGPAVDASVSPRACSGAM